MGEGEGGRRLRLRPSLRPRRAYGPVGGASAPEGEPLARRGVDKKAKSPLPFTLLDMVFYSALLSRKRSI